MRRVAVAMAFAAPVAVGVVVSASRLEFVLPAAGVLVLAGACVLTVHKWLTLTAVALLSVAHWKLVGTTLFSEAILAGVAVLIVAAAVQRPSTIRRPPLLVILFAIGLIGSAVIAVISSDQALRPANVTAVVLLGSQALLLLLASAVPVGEESAKYSTQIVIVAIVGLTVAALVGLYQFATGGDLPFGSVDLAQVATDAVAGNPVPWYGRAYGYLGNPNTYGLAMAIAACMLVGALLLGSLGRTVRRLAIVAFAILTLGVVASLSQGALLSLAAGITISTFVRDRRWGLIVAVLIGGSAIAASQYLTDVRLSGADVRASQAVALEDSRSARAAVAAAALDTVVAHPLEGIGYNNFQQIGGYGLNTHNEFLRVAAETGLPVAALYVLAVGAIGRIAFVATRRRKTRWLGAGVLGALAAYAVGSNFINDLEYPSITGQVLVYVGALLAAGDR